jgi:hypothetical protein
MAAAPVATAEGLPIAVAGLLRLDHATIEREVTEHRPGVYVLLSEHNHGGRLEYVGRADEDMNERLKEWMNSFGWFFYAYADSATDAFQKECALYHHINPPANAVHPVPPAGSSCPVCG